MGGWHFATNCTVGERYLVRTAVVKDLSDVLPFIADAFVETSRKRPKIDLQSPVPMRNRKRLDIYARVQVNSNGNNKFFANYLWFFSLDESLKLADKGSLVGLIPPVSSIFDPFGPVDPRGFQVNGSRFLIYNMGAFFGKQLYLDYTFMFDLTRGISVTPLVNGHVPLLKGLKKTTRVMRDKHWTPLIVGSEAFFVRYYDPLEVLQCQLPSGECHVAHPKDGAREQNYNDFTHPVRGGTQFIQLQGNYYWSIVHVTLFPFSEGNSYTRLYTMNFLLMHVKPFRVVFLSDPIVVAESLFSEKSVKNYTRFKHFCWPNGTEANSDNEIFLGVHVDDKLSALLSVLGHRSVLMHAIHADRNSEVKEHRQGSLHETARNLARKFLRPGEKFKVRWNHYYS